MKPGIKIMVLFVFPVIAAIAITAGTAFAQTSGGTAGGMQHEGMGGQQGGMALYHNLGEGKFADVTEAVGLNPKAPGFSCAKRVGLSYSCDVVG